MNKNLICSQLVTRRNEPDDLLGNTSKYINNELSVFALFVFKTRSLCVALAVLKFSM